MTTPAYKVQLLGPLLVLHGDRPVQFAYQKAAAIVAYVAAEGHPVTRERLRTLLWEECDDQRAGANLRHALHQLRTAAPGLLTEEGDRVGLAAADVDVCRLEQRADDLLGVRRGPFCEGLTMKDSVAFDDWVSLQRSRYDALYVEAMLARAEQRAQAGQLDAAVDAARHALATDPLHEPTHARLISLHLARGETTAAWRQLQECRRLLEAELGTSVSHETLALMPESPSLTDMVETFRRSQQISATGLTRLDAELEDLRSVEPAPSEAPRERVVGAMPAAVAQHFKDRQRELGLLESALGGPETRLVVVCGPGGLGKTALVTRFLHHRLAQDAPESIVYLTCRRSELSPVGKIVDLLCRTLEPVAAHELMATWQRDVPLTDKLEVLFHRFLGQQRTLIVLDNLEIVLDDDNHIAEEHADVRIFLESCIEWDHAARILATSRRSLVLSRNLEGRAVNRHIELALDTGLPSPEAAQLLHELDADGTLGLREASPETISEVVAACHGIPRSLEALAGTLRQRRTLTLTRLLEDQETFRRVTEDPARELYHALTPEEQLIVQALAVLDRPMPVAALHYLLPGLSIDDRLETLVRNYVVAFDSGRFHVHGLLRQYAYRQLSRKAALHARAAEFFHRLRRPKHAWKSLGDLDEPLQEFHHLVLADQFDRAGQVVDELDTDYLSLWGYPSTVIEMRRTLAGRLQEADVASQNWGRLGVALRDTGEVHESVQYFQRALDVATRHQDDHAVSTWLANLGLAHGRLGEWNSAVDYATRALGLARQRRFRALEARSLTMLGHAFRHLGRFEEARTVYEEALDITREVGDRRRQGVLFNVLSHAWLGLGVEGRALEACERALAISLEVGHRPGQGAALSTRGKVEVWKGNFEAALPPLHEALAIARDVNLHTGVADSLEALGYAWHHLGQIDRAVAMYQETLDLEGPVLSYSALVRYALVVLQTGDEALAHTLLQRAVDVCQALLLTTPEAFRRWYTLGLAQLAMGLPEALETYTRALQVAAVAGVVEEARQHLVLVGRTTVPADRVAAVRALLGEAGGGAGRARPARRPAAAGGGGGRALPPSPGGRRPARRR